MFYEWECGDSQQGSSSKGALLTAVSSARALSQTGAGLSGHQIVEVDSEEIEVVYSEEAPGNVEAGVLHGIKGIEPIVESYLGEGMLLKYHKSIVMNGDVKLWRYIYKIPSSVEIWVPITYEIVDWVVLDWVVVIS